jgi:NADH-ubiquinone oxidoreductase chain 3
MTSTTFFFVFIPLLAIILLAVNLIFAPHNPYQEKDSAFECGFHSFLGQNRTQFSISFFIFALLFLLFDLEILLVYPYVVSAYTNGVYGLTIMLIFFLALTLGFAFELGKNALKIDSRQMLNLSIFKLSTISHISSFKFSIHRNMSKYPLSIFFSIVFLVSLLTIIIYYMDINVLKKYLDIYTLLGCGLLS